MKIIRKIIREIIEFMFLNEITINPTEPQNYQKFDLDGEIQYGFQTKSENIYYLSLKETTIKTDDEEVLKLYEGKPEPGEPLDFIAINFFAGEDNPNEENAFKRETNRFEQYDLASKLIFLFNKFIEENDSKNFLFSAEPKRMNLYKNIFSSYENKFYILPPKKYDKSYEYNMVILIKK